MLSRDHPVLEAKQGEGLTPDDHGNQRQKKELPVSLCCSYTRHNLPRDCQLLLLPAAQLAGSSVHDFVVGKLRSQRSEAATPTPVVGSTSTITDWTH